MEQRALKTSWDTMEAYLGHGDSLEKAQWEYILHTKWIGEKMFCFPLIDSTNTKAKEFAAQGYPSGTVVLAEAQSAGKGRRGRSWESSKGKGIFMTLLLRPEILPDNASMLTLAAALAVSAALKNLTGYLAEIKWPNDIVMDGKKICGILTEMGMQSQKIEYIVVGIGINVNTESFPEELADMASSLYLATGKYWNRAALIGEILKQFERYYDVFCKTEDLCELVEEYNLHLVNRNRKVRILDPKKPMEGMAEGITPRGELIVDTPDGKILVSAGEVSVRGIYGYV